jgi:hypothetical protein
MGDVDFSNTGIPAAVDLMMGLGADKSDLESNHRVVSFPKNKIGGDHTPTIIEIDPKRSLVLRGVNPRMPMRYKKLLEKKPEHSAYWGLRCSVIGCGRMWTLRIALSSA